MFSKVLRITSLFLLAFVLVSCRAGKPAEKTPIAQAPTPPTEKSEVVAVAAVTAEAPAPAAAASSIILRQPLKSRGGLIPAAWRQPQGSESDRSVWDNFVFEADTEIAEFRWRGGYDPAKKGSGGKVLNFTVDIYSAIETGSEPNLAVAPLVHYVVGGNAGEQPAETLAGVQLYEYRFALPAPFKAEALKAYWVQIVAFQAGEPDWGLAVGSLGDGRHFRLSGARGEGYYHQLIPEDVALEIAVHGKDAPTPSAEVASSLEEIAEQMANLPPAEEVPTNSEGVQEVMLVVSRSGYTPVHFAVKRGVPVRIVFRQLGYVPGGNELNVRWGAEHETYVMLASLNDKKVIEFTPQELGDFRYSCPHEWYWGVMTVHE